MEFKIPKNTSKHYWTRHAIEKMRFYGLSEQRVRAVIRNPRRKEEGIVENTIAVMQPPSIKIVANKPVWKQEIWAMYQNNTKNRPIKKTKIKIKEINKLGNSLDKQKQIRIISAWRYPGVSPKKDPIPQDILDELGNIN